MTRDPDQLAIKTLKALSMDAVQAANSGHPGTPMALAPLGQLLFNELMVHDAADPNWFDRDRFVLSCGHASMLIYGLLHLHGYDLSLDDLKAFRQWGSKTPGHPEYGHTAGVETTTGPLGQGVANAIGLAMAEKHLAAHFNRDGHTIIDHNTWVIASDGDLMEGVSAEASSLAGQLGLGKLVVYWDDNEITIDGRTDLSFKEDVLARYRAYGWQTLEVASGDDLEALRAVTREALADEARPTLVRVKTIIGDPSPNKRDSSAAHGAPLGTDEVAATKKIMEWPEEPFHVPAELATMTAASKQRGSEAHTSWTAAFEQYEKAHPGLAKELESVMRGELPEGWDAKLPEFGASDPEKATRQHGAAVLNGLAEGLPHLIGGSADLAGSNGSWQKGRPTFGMDDGEGAPRNVHFGVREHGMASICNGMALHGGIQPYCATFLIFSDYMRPSIRLAALMQLPVRYVFTHDSIGLGEDGPTHQPIEQLASLRAIPGLDVYRPADAHEVREAWRTAVGSAGPAAFALSRQKVPNLDRGTLADAGDTARGGYVLKEASSGTPQLILIGTGAEVGLCLEAAGKLEADGIATRVVSMPCLDRFEAEDAAWQESVLPASVAARLVVEAGVRQGWDRWIGAGGDAITMTSFGASAPAPVLFEKFGFSVDEVVSRGRKLLG